MSQFKQEPTIHSTFSCTVIPQEQLQTTRFAHQGMFETYSQGGHAQFNNKVMNQNTRAPTLNQTSSKLEEQKHNVSLLPSMSN